MAHNTPAATVIRELGVLADDRLDLRLHRFRQQPASGTQSTTIVRRARPTTPVSPPT